MVGSKEKSEHFAFESEQFTISAACLATKADWCEFSVMCNGVLHESIGGQSRADFLKGLHAVLCNSRGTKVKDIPNAPFTELLGDARYLGYLVFSGYNTLYFFRTETDALTVVLADAHGKMITHGSLDAQASKEWEKKAAIAITALTELKKDSQKHY